MFVKLLTATIVLLHFPFVKDTMKSPVRVLTLDTQHHSHTGPLMPTPRFPALRAARTLLWVCGHRHCAISQRLIIQFVNY